MQYFCELAFGEQNITVFLTQHSLLSGKDGLVLALGGIELTSTVQDAGQLIASA
jgi:hypothetical protein